jgi:hypothetical protein
MDEPPPEGIQEDSANLKEKIILALSDEATIEDIQTEIYKDRNAFGRLLLDATLMRSETKRKEKNDSRKTG